jgi:hypothetical protein
VSTTLREALAELVALKDLKDEESRLRQRREYTRLRGSEEMRGKVDAMRDDYNRRKPLAWAAARAALAQSDAQPVAWRAKSVHGWVYDEKPGGMGLVWCPLVEPSSGGRCASGDSTSAKPEPQRFPSPSEQPRAAGFNQCAASPQEAQPERKSCHLCDCTGDIHDATGEWRGECPYCKPAAQPERERLSDEQLRDIFRKSADNLTLRSHWPALKAFAREVERIVRGEGAV